MIKPFANSARAVASGPLTWRTWTGLVVVPILIAGLLAWAFWSPQTDHGTAEAAVVNNDEPVKVNGQTLPLGRQLAGELTHSDDSAYSWQLTDAADAAAGLADGTYASVVTIPKNFSARATSAATNTKQPLKARRAVVDVATSESAGIADPKLSGEIAKATQRTLNRQIVETYLDNVYVSFSRLHTQLGRAADGAGQLADGTAKLVPGARKVADGARELDTAAGKLNSGATELAAGTTRLADGSEELSSGLTKAERDTKQLPALTRELAAGARQVADGNAELAGTVVPLANRVIAAIDALPSATDAAERFQRLADECDNDPRFCADLRAAADRFTAEAGKIDSTRDSIRASVVELRDSVQALASGARRVANGNAELADKTPALAGGIADAADGARQLDDGIDTANSGAHELADGTGQLVDGSGQLADGSAELADGTVKANDGAQELASQLDQGRDQVPNYSKSEREHLRTVAATPSDATGGSVDFGRSALALFIVLALWACALATYLVTRAVPAGVLTSREPTWRIIVRAALPGVTTAVLAAVGLSAVLAPLLELSFGRWCALLGVSLLAALTFVALNQALVAIFRRPGRHASLAVLVLTIATSVVATIPGPLYALGDYLPTHGAILALRTIITGGDADQALSGLGQLVVWLVIGSAAAVAVTDRRRSLSARQLRAGTFLPVST